MLSTSLILSLHCCWAWLPSSSFLSSDLNHSIAFDLKTLRSEEWGLPSHCLFFFFFAVAVLRFDFGILHGRMSFMLDCGWMFHTFTFGLLWFFFFVIGGVVGFVLCFLWMGLGKFFFFGYRCNMIFFFFFLMFFMGWSWQASSWLGWACFC